jgi:hypothetical protein
MPAGPKGKHGTSPLTLAPNPLGERGSLKDPAGALTAADATAASLAMASGKWATVLRTLRTVDALGDITTYVGQAARLPGKAAAVLRRKLGKGAAEAGELAEGGLEAEGAAARAVTHAEEAGQTKHSSHGATQCGTCRTS